MNYKDLGKRDGRRCIELGDTKKDWHFVLLFGMGGRHFSFLSFSFVFLLECIRYMADDDGGGGWRGAIWILEASIRWWLVC